MQKTTFSMRRRNPDVLSCIANLSSDEVFTSPELANSVLDSIELGWATRYGGANIWRDSSVTFLDPCAIPSSESMRCSSGTAIVRRRQSPAHTFARVQPVHSQASIALPDHPVRTLNSYTILGG